MESIIDSNALGNFIAIQSFNLIKKRNKQGVTYQPVIKT